MNILSNPIFIGLFAALIVGGILYWNYTQEIEKNKKYKIDQKIKINYMLPILVGITVWFLVSSYQEYYPSIEQVVDLGKTIDNTVIDKLASPNKDIVKKVSEGFHSIENNNIRMPTNDIFLDIAAF